ncbi:MAG: cytochrome c maturation protein CcmE [candidate division KSB1 bacterium]
MERRRITIFAVFAAVIGIIGWLFVSGFNDTMVYYITVSELKTQGVKAEGKGLRVSGKVVPGTVARSSDGLVMTFTLDELGETMPVSYRGIVPDTFKEDAGVLLEGKFVNGEFQAKQVFTKCASKYEGEEGGGYGTEKKANAS